MTLTINNIIEYTIWLVCLFIFVKFIIPNVSSLLREKLTGESKKENFDLESLIEREKRKILLQKAQDSTLFEKVLEQRELSDTLQFIQTANFSNQELGALVVPAQKLWHDEAITESDLKRTLSHIIVLKNVENSPLVQLEILKRAIIFYVNKFRFDEDSTNHWQQIFNETYHLLSNKDLSLEEIKNNYKGADFTTSS